MAARRKIEEKHNNDTQQLEIKIKNLSSESSGRKKKGTNFISKNQNETLGSSEKQNKKKLKEAGVEILEEE